jgi:hypothetical protein
MSFKYRVAQIIKLSPTGRTLVPLAMGLVSMRPALVDVARLAVRATNPPSASATRGPLQSIWRRQSSVGCLAWPNFTSDPVIRQAGCR